MRTLFFICLTAILTNGCAPAPPQAAATTGEVKPDFKPVADIHQLMTAIVIPTSDALFEVGSKAPADDKAWAALENAAITLAESGNLLMIGNRARQEKSWMDFAGAMTAAAESAIQATRKKSVDEVLAAGDQIYATCENCHNQYMDKGEGAN